MKGLLANEKHLQDAAMDEEEDDGNEDFQDEEDEQEVHNKLKQRAKKFVNGKPADGDEVSDDDEADDDFQEAAGEYAPYDSPMESTDELIYIKETMDAIYQADQNTYGHITSAISEEDLNAFIELLSRADDLKQRETNVKRAFEEEERSQKQQ